MSEKNLDKSGRYFCEFCQYKTNDKCDYEKHILTRKHIMRTNSNNFEHQKSVLYVCENCNKTYKARSGLWSHKKKCHNSEEKQINQIENNENKIVEHKEVNYEKIILDLISQNKELQKTINDIIPKIGNNNNNNSNNNINIKIDNITLLNDKCKDAISISDFIESIEIGVKDLLFTSKKGLTNGVSNLFIEQLNSLPLVKRPIWCSDKKRKKLFIKECEWSEDTDQKKTKQAIKNLTVKQMKNINKYKEENPDWFNNDKKKDKFLEIVKEATKELDEDKQISIINNLLDTIHLTNNNKEELQNIQEISCT